jgi:beta-N-acetylhexosaminidase
MKKAVAVVAWLFLTLRLDAGVSALAGMTPTEERSIESRIDAMTPDQRVGQLLLVGFDGHHLNSALREMVLQWGIGGVVFYRANITAPSQAQKLVRAIRRLSPQNVPFMAIDHEGGVVLRFSGDDELPPAMAFGAAHSEDLAFRAGKDVGTRLRALGFTMNFAPVLDVYSNPDSAIGTRAFSDDPRVVGAIGTAFIRGQSAANVISVAKHFVGEGSAAGDTHRSPARTTASAAALESVDLQPFRTAIAEGLPAIMTSHVAAPQLTYDAFRPITLSSEVLTGVLRERLGFTGLIVTDALEMRAVTEYYELGELAVRAVEAGADMVVTSGTFAEQRVVFDHLRDAYRSGRLSDARIRASLRRILLAKTRCQADSSEWNRAASRALVRDVAADSVTVVHQNEGALSLLRDAVRSRKAVCVGPKSFCDRLQLTGCDLPMRIRSESEIAGKCLARSAASRWIIAAIQNRSQAEVIAAIRHRRPDAELVAVSLGNPHDLQVVTGASVYIAAYGASSPIESAVAEVIRGTLSARGSLPVRLSQ